MQTLSRWASSRLRTCWRSCYRRRSWMRPTSEWPTVWSAQLEAMLLQAAAGTLATCPTHSSPAFIALQPQAPTQAWIWPVNPTMLTRSPLSTCHFPQLCGQPAQHARQRRLPGARAAAAPAPAAHRPRAAAAHRRRRLHDGRLVGTGSTASWPGLYCRRGRSSSSRSGS